MQVFAGKYPAVVRSYNAKARTCRVEIPGITDGAELMPVAEIEYPIGDKSRAAAHATEIEILPGDLVWVEFIAGDPRYPLITGWRNPGAGNSTGWRRVHHANIEFTADGVFRINAAKVEINAPTAIVGKSLTHNGTNVGDTHVHGSITAGPGKTSTPE